MDTETIIRYTLSEKEIKEAIRKHFIDIIGTGVSFDTKDIYINTTDNKIIAILTTIKK
jgi:hypothetical protein